MKNEEEFRIEIVGAKEAALQYLRNMILTGEFAGGQKLNEMQLSATLGISRPPIREAFPILESECLISTESRRGVYVTNLSITDCLDLYRTRYSIEASAIDLIKEKTISDFGKMQQALDIAKNLEFPKSGGLSAKLEFFGAFSLFHIKLIESCDSKWLKHLYSSISPSLSRYIFLYTEYLSDPEKYREAVNGHEILLDRIRKGQYEEAKKFLWEHIETSVDVLKHKIKD